MSNPEQSKINEQLGKLLEDVSSLAEQVQLKLHLGGMDAKDAWKNLEPRVSELKQRVTATSGTVAQDLSKSASDLKTELHDLAALLGITK